MSRYLFYVYIACCWCGSLFGADSDTATVTFSVSAINELAVSGNPAAFTVNSATAGNQPVSIQDSSTTYNITTNESSKVITGALDVALPSGLSLDVTLTAPTGATSAGAVTLTTVSQNLVTGISQVAESNLGITYDFSATVSAGTQTLDTRTVTYTIGP